MIYPSKVLWTGLAVVDAHGRAQLWNGGHTPKLYRSEEQGRYACTDGSSLEEVTLLIGHVDGEPARGEDLARRIYEAIRIPLPVAPAPRPAPPADIERRPHFAPKRCRSCRGVFTPKSGRALDCEDCR